ncbi:MAG: integrase family protein [Caulobacteraceae bacterium]|nr:MAG: integrase family protein [Caulobacteraceae bacterium]
MATFTLLKSGAWRAQVRRKGAYVAESFLRKTEALTWAREAELAIDAGVKPPRRGQLTAKRKGVATFGQLVDQHLEDMADVKRTVARSKRFTLELLKDEFGNTAHDALTRERLVEYGRKRARGGAGPATLAIDFAFLNTVLTHAAAVHGVPTSTEQLKLARAALARLGLIGKSQERDRRASQDELDHLTAYLDGNPRQGIPTGRMVRFAVATAMRIEEICRIRWADVDEKKRTVTVRDRKDPRHKEGNHQRVPLLDATGYDAWALLQEQGKITGHRERIFPYDSRSVSAAFRRACRELEIEDLRFHDLRHEAASRLFEAGFKIEQVALVTGHKDWKMLKRYTNLRPEGLHDAASELKRGRKQSPQPRSSLRPTRVQNTFVVESEDEDELMDSARMSKKERQRRALAKKQKATGQAGYDKRLDALPRKRTPLID